MPCFIHNMLELTNAAPRGVVCSLVECAFLTKRVPSSRMND